MKNIEIEYCNNTKTGMVKHDNTEYFFKKEGTNYIVNGIYKMFKSFNDLKKHFTNG